jgi:hypothetical protein
MSVFGRASLLSKFSCTKLFDELYRRVIAVITLRTYAVYNQNRYVLIALGTLSLLAISLDVVSLMIEMDEFKF